MAAYKLRLGLRNRKGAAVVEFAIVAPFVLAVFFASFEFCRVAMIRHAADNAVYEGARQAIIPGGTANAAEATARRVLAAVGANNADVTVTPANIADSTRDVTVQVIVPLNNNSFVAPLFFRNKSVARELTMRREGKR